MTYLELEEHVLKRGLSGMCLDVHLLTIGAVARCGHYGCTIQGDPGWTKKR
jgi:hypothetical protein